MLRLCALCTYNDKLWNEDILRIADVALVEKIDQAHRICITVKNMNLLQVLVSLVQL